MGRRVHCAQSRLDTTEQRHVLDAYSLKHRVEVVHLLLKSAWTIERIRQSRPPAVESHDPCERRKSLPAAKENRLLRLQNQMRRYPANTHNTQRPFTHHPVRDARIASAGIPNRPGRHHRLRTLPPAPIRSPTTR
jgi:hypothetical protein